MYLNVDELRRTLYNVLLWTPGKGDAKKYISQGLVLVSFHDADLGALSTDGYVVVRSGPKVRRANESTQYYLRGEDVKTILQNLPDDKEEIEVSPDPTHLYFGKTQVEPQQPADDKFWESIQQLAFRNHSEANPTDFMEFYLDPRRLQKFSLVEPRATYPLAFAQKVTDFDQPVFVWKYGPRLGGIFSPLAVEALVAAYPDDDGQILW